MTYEVGQKVTVKAGVIGFLECEVVIKHVGRFFIDVKSMSTGVGYTIRRGNIVRWFK
jgi:hypothetical protein